MLDADIQKKIASSFDPQKAEEAQRWVEALVGEQFHAHLQGGLKSGVALCKLINAIKPGLVRTINIENTPFKQRENINNYLSACKQLGMEDSELFVATDLFEGQNMVIVLHNLFALGSIAQLPEFGLKGPVLGKPSTKPRVVVRRVEPAPPVPVEIVAAPADMKRALVKPSVLSADGSALDADIKKKLNSKLDANKQNGFKVISWLSKLTGQSLGDNLEQELKSGIVLCNAMNVIRPGSVAKIHTINSAFKHRENLENFLRACKIFGMQSSDCFVVQDLYDGKNLSIVIDCLLQLERMFEARGEIAHRESNTDSSLRAPEARVAPRPDIDHFCGLCGAPREADAIFCVLCGANI
jgi:hypothetical protein